MSYLKRNRDGYAVDEFGTLITGGVTLYSNYADSVSGVQKVAVAAMYPLMSLNSTTAESFTLCAGYCSTLNLNEMDIYCTVKLGGIPYGD